MEELLRDLESALRFVPFGLQFGIQLNIEKVEREIDRQIALHGMVTSDVVIARFTLVFSQKNAEEGANYIELYYDELSKYFDRKMLRSLQIELFSQSGLPERAKECLHFISDNLSAEEEKALLSIIADSNGSDPIGDRISRFKDTRFHR